MQGIKEKKHIVLVVISLVIWLVYFCSGTAWSKSLPKPQLVVQTGHLDKVNSVAYSPDGKMMASGSEDFTVKIWNASLGREFRTLSGHEGGVSSVAFSPDSKVVASGSDDSTIKFWDVTSGQELRTLRGHERSIMSVAFSPNGKTLVSGGMDNAIIFWDVDSGKEVRTITEFKDFVRSIAFSSDGKTIVSGHDNDSIKIWHVNSGREIRELTGHTNSVYSVAFSPNGKMIVSASIDDTVKIWDVATGSELHTLKGGDSIYSVAFSPHGKMVAVAGRNDGDTSENSSAITLWDAITAKKIRSLKGAVVGPVAFSPDGKTLISGDGNGMVTRWNVATGEEKPIILGYGTAWDDLAVPSAKNVLVARNKEEIVFWDIATGWNHHTVEVSNIFAISPNNKMMVVPDNYRKAAELRDVETGKKIQTLKVYETIFSAAAFSPDGKTVALAGLQEIDKGCPSDIDLWNIATKQIKQVGYCNISVHEFAFSPDGKMLAVAEHQDSRWNYGAGTPLFDTKTGEKIHTLQGPRQENEEISPGVLHSVAFSPDGKAVAAGGNGNIIELWDATTGRMLYILKGHKKKVNSVVFAPDGKTIVTASEDATLKIWNVATGVALHTLKGHTGKVTAVVFSPDGKRVVSSGDDRTIRFWNPEKGQLLGSLIKFNDDQWLVTNAEGRYDSSGNGRMPYIHWVEGRKITLAQQMKSRYYEPGLLAKIMGHNKKTLGTVPIR